MKYFILISFLLFASYAQGLSEVDKQDLTGVKFNTNGGGENGLKGYTSSPAGIMVSEKIIIRSGNRSIKCVTSLGNYCETPLFEVPSEAVPAISFYYDTTSADYTYQVRDSLNNAVGISHAMPACAEFCISELGTFTPVLGTKYKIRITSNNASSQTIYFDDMSIASDSSGPVGEVNTASNIGIGGGEVYKQKVGTDLRLRTIKAGSGIGISNDADEITVNATGGGGEANTASNVGTGTGQSFKQKTGNDLEFKTFKAGSGIGISNDTNEITINATGGGGTVWKRVNFNCSVPSVLHGHNFSGAVSISNISTNVYGETGCIFTYSNGNFTYPDNASQLSCFITHDPSLGILGFNTAQKIIFAISYGVLSNDIYIRCRKIDDTGCGSFKVKMACSGF